MEFDLHTQGQIVNIQIRTIMDFLTNITDKGYVIGKDADKIQRMFKIVNEKEIEDNNGN